MSIKPIEVPVRFFCYNFDNDEVEIGEISEEAFLALVRQGYEISYERSAVFLNGVSQICLTVENL